ncbi:unnamed protein product [Closterium sp. NIES-64]|nr:unnamed protein product [Closterium sp. NIES-64]
MAFPRALRGLPHVRQLPVAGDAGKQSQRGGKLASLPAAIILPQRGGSWTQRRAGRGLPAALGALWPRSSKGRNAGAGKGWLPRGGSSGGSGAAVARGEAPGAESMEAEMEGRVGEGRVRGGRMREGSFHEARVKEAAWELVVERLRKSEGAISGSGGIGGSSEKDGPWDGGRISEKAVEGDRVGVGAAAVRAGLVESLQAHFHSLPLSYASAAVELPPWEVVLHRDLLASAARLPACKPPVVVTLRPHHGPAAATAAGAAAGSAPRSGSGSAYSECCRRVMGSDAAGGITNCSSTTGGSKAGAAVAALGTDTVVIDRSPGSGDSCSGAGGVTGRGAASSSAGLDGDGGGNEGGLFFSWQGYAAPELAVSRAAVSGAAVSGAAVSGAAVSGAAVSGAAVSGAAFMPGSGSKQQVQRALAAARGDHSAERGGGFGGSDAGPGCLGVEAGDWGMEGEGKEVGEKGAGQQGSGRRGSSGVWSPQGAYGTQGDGSTGSTCSGGSGRGGFSWGRGGFSVWEEEEVRVDRREGGGNALDSQKEDTPAVAPDTGVAERELLAPSINTPVGDGGVDARQGRVGEGGVAAAGAAVGGGRRCKDSTREGGNGDASLLQHESGESGAAGPAVWVSGGVCGGRQAGSGKGGEKGGGEVGVGVPGAVRSSADAAKGVESAADGAAAVGGAAAGAVTVGAAVLGACDADGGNGATGGREGTRNEQGLVQLLLSERGLMREQLGHFLLDPLRLDLGPLIATGASGEVRRGRYAGEPVAVKILKGEMRRDGAVAGIGGGVGGGGVTAAGSSGATARAEFRREVMAMVSCGQRCPQLLRFYGVCVDVRHRMCIVTKLMPGGTLHDLLRRRNGVGLPLLQLLRVALDIALGMRFLHRHGIIHRPTTNPAISTTPIPPPPPFSSDLKTANVLLDEHGRAVVGDFGVARLVGDGAEMTKEVGTYRWMAPEAFGTTGHWSVTPRSDVYSFGIVLWELLTARLPYESYSPLQAAVAVALNGLRPAIPAGCPEGLRRLIEACWARDPAERPDSEDVVRVVRGLRRELMGEESVEDEEETSGGNGEHVVSGGR